MPPADALWLAALLAALVPIGHFLAKVVPAPAETLWFCCGFLASIAARLLGAPRLDALDWLAPVLWSVLLPVFVFVRAFRIDRRALGFHLFPVIALATLAIGCGIAATTGALAVIDRATLPWIAAVVLGVALASTDATAVTSMLRRLVPRGVPILLGGEAVFAAALAYALIDAALDARSSAAPDAIAAIARAFAIAFVGGAAIGGGLGWIGLALARFATKGVLPAPLVAGVALVAHQAAQALGLSGVAACLVAGLATGAATDPTAEQRISKVLEVALRGSLFALGGAWLAIVATAAPFAVLVLAVAAMCCARLATVHALTWAVAKLARMGLTRRERMLLAAFSARGANTIALVLALGTVAPWAAMVQSVALVVVAFDLSVTAPASRWLARRFGNPPFGATEPALAPIGPRSPT